VRESLHQPQEAVGPGEVVVGETVQDEPTDLPDRVPQAEEVRFRFDRQLRGAGQRGPFDDRAEKARLDRLLQRVERERFVAASLAAQSIGELGQHPPDLLEVRRGGAVGVQPRHGRLGEATKPARLLVQVLATQLPLTEMGLDGGEHAVR